jgi:SAM-dependent methyltransferase
LKSLVRLLVPGNLRRQAHLLLRWNRERRRKWKRQLPVGWVRFGSLRRVQPIAPDFGWRWGQSIERHYIEDFIGGYAADIHGRVLEVAERKYTEKFGGARVTQSDVLHAKAGNPEATIIADLTRGDDIPSNAFDCIVLTQTLQFIYDTRAALRTLYRILKPGGVLLATCHGISQIARYDMDNWGEYWRFTSLSARMLFGEIFQDRFVTVRPYGNVLAATAFLHGLSTEELRQDELDYHDPNYELILCIRAVKSPDNQQAVA